MFLSEFFNKNQGVTESRTEGEATLAKIAASGDDGYEMIYDGLNGLLGGEAEIMLQDMYDDVSREHRLHPDDDFEQIQSLMMDRIESEYGQGVAEEQLDEISDRAMHKYRQSAHNQIQHHMFGGGKNKPNAQAIIAKREKGMDVASNKIIARRKSEQDKQIAGLIAKLPELKARYAELEAQYKSLGGSNWQYADREQNLTDTERRARDLEGPMNDLWRQINTAEKAQREQGVAEGTGNIGSQIKALYRKIYNAGDDAIEFMYYDSPIFAQYWDEYEGDLDSIIAEVDPSELQIIYDELVSAAENEGLAEGVCSECGGPAFSDLILAEKQDACYNKVKSRYKVWPSAYASGALVQCRKKGAANWGNSKNEGVAEGKEDKVKQLKQDYATAVHWSKNETSPQKREAARQKAEKIKAHLEKQYKKGVAEGANRLDMVGFHLDSERAYNAVMSRFGHVIDYNEDSGIMYVPERLWPTVEVVAYDADGIGAQRDDDLENPEHYGVAEDQLDENLKKWFKEKWVRFGPDGKIRGACARGDSSEGKPKCLPQSKAHSLGKKGRASAAAKKRREDPNPERKGPAINVATKKKSNEGIAEDANHSMLELSSMIFSNIEKKYPQLINTLGQSSVSDAVMSAVENAGSVNSVDEVYSILQDVISILKKKSKTLPMSETRVYYNVVGTLTESLKNNFKMSQDTHGWYIANTASETLHRAAERAFGAPKKS